MEDLHKIAAYCDTTFIGHYVSDLTIDGASVVIHLDSGECFTVQCEDYPALCRAVGEEDIATLVEQINDLYEGTHTVFYL